MHTHTHSFRVLIVWSVVANKLACFWFVYFWKTFASSSCFYSLFAFIFYADSWLLFLRCWILAFLLYLCRISMCDFFPISHRSPGLVHRFKLWYTQPCIWVIFIWLRFGQNHTQLRHTGIIHTLVGVGVLPQQCVLHRPFTHTICISCHCFKHFTFCPDSSSF